MTRDQKLEERIGDFWSKSDKESQKNRGLKLRWWQSPFIIQHVNKKFSGELLKGLSQGIISKAKKVMNGRLPLEKGISVGCGAGQKEIDLVRQKFVNSFDLFELSEDRIKMIRQSLKTYDLEKNFNIYKENAFEYFNEPESYDLIHWNNSLHHMFNMDSVIKWSYTLLKKGGLFFMDDYVGPSRFQWPDKMLNIVNNIRLKLDEKYFLNPKDNTNYLPRIIKRPDLKGMIEADPSEAAESDKIIESIKKYFPNVDITYTGGVIYHLALKDIIHNFDDEKDKMILELLMVIDDLCSECGENHYATALAIKE